MKIEYIWLYMLTTVEVLEISTGKIEKLQKKDFISLLDGDKKFVLKPLSRLVEVAIQFMPLLEKHDDLLSKPAIKLSDVVPPLLSSYEMLLFLIQNGFDVFGLIKQGYAVESKN